MEVYKYINERTYIHTHAHAHNCVLGVYMWTYIYYYNLCYVLIYTLGMGSMRIRTSKGRSGEVFLGQVYLGEQSMSSLTQDIS